MSLYRDRSPAQALVDHYRSLARGRVGLIDGHPYMVRDREAAPCEEPASEIMRLGDVESAVELWRDVPKGFILSKHLGDILRPLGIAEPDGALAVPGEDSISVAGGRLALGRRDYVARTDRMLPCVPKEGECPQYLALLNHLSDGKPAVADALESVVGAALIGVKDDRIVILNDHVGGTGKSTWLNVVKAACGGYACDISGACLSSEDRATGASEVIEMAGRRVAIAPELSARMIGSARAKQIASHEATVVREAYAKPVKVTPTATIIAACNSLPDLPNDAAIGRRLIIVPTTHERPERPDPGLAARIIAAELPQVLYRLLVSGARAMRDGLDAHIADANIAPEVTSEIDVMGDFLAGWSKGGRTLSSTAWVRYVEMCRAAGIEHDTRTAWGRRMSEQFGKSRVSHGQRYYKITWTGA